MLPAEELHKILAEMNGEAESMIPKLEQLAEIAAGLEVPELNALIAEMMRYFAWVRIALVAVANADAR